MSGLSFIAVFQGKPMARVSEADASKGMILSIEGTIYRVIKNSWMEAICYLEMASIREYKQVKEEYAAKLAHEELFKIPIEEAIEGSFYSLGKKMYKIRSVHHDRREVALVECQVIAKD